eukprot:EG_transcript_14786
MLLCHGARDALVARLLRAKDASELSFNALARILGVTNVYAAQLFYNQAQLKPLTAAKLQGALGDAISVEDLQLMQQAPMRSWDDDIVKEPNVYRTVEACQHYGQGLKLVLNEKFGDGIMSAIDFYATVERVVGAYGEPRVLLTFNGKFLPHVEQQTALMGIQGLPAPAAPVPPPPPPPTAFMSSYTCPSSPVALQGAEKQAFVADLLRLKANAGLTFDKIAEHLGVTNLFAAQLLLNQARLLPATAGKLQQILPGLTPAHVALMSLPPMRSFDPAILEEPNVYRTLEACKHYGLAIKATINELFGDGIMSAIDVFLTLRRATGPQGEARVVLTFNGKFLPHVEQTAEGVAAMSFE